MKITNEFTVPIPIDQAWSVLTDLEGIAPCMPGAQLTGVDGEVYKGKVKVKVGPVISDFAGTARFVEKDATAYRAVIDAKGRDARSAGNAAAVVSAVLTADGENRTKVSVDTDLKISGKLAQFGSGMIKEVSSKLLAQFVANLEAKLAADPTPSAPAVSDPAAAAPADPAPSAFTPAGPAPAASASDAAPAASGGTVPGASASSGSAPSASAPAVPTSASGSGGAASASAAADVASMNGASAAAVETAPDTAVALSTAAPAATLEPGADPAAPVVPDPSAGEVEPAAGRTETAEGTLEPVAPLRTPNADLPAAGSATTERAVQSAEPEPLDLLDIAGGSIYKRVIPVAVGVAVAAAAVIVWFVARG